TLQPVAFSNGPAHFFSAYPSRTTIVSFPSPFPTELGTAFPFETPAAGTTSAATTAASATCTKRIRFTFPPHRLRTPRPDARTAGRACPPSRGRPPTTSPG